MRTRYLLMLVLFVLLSSVGGFSQEKINLHPADTLVIQYIDVEGAASKFVVIEGASKRQGDRFVGKDVIDWPKTPGVNYISVIHLRTGESIQMCSPSYKKPERGYFSYLKKVRTGTKGLDKKQQVQDMKAFLSQKFYMVDGRLYIWSSLVVDSEHVYMLSPVNCPGAKSFRMMYNAHEPHLLYLPVSQLVENNIDINEGPCVFRVNYLEEGDDTFITDKFSVEVCK